MKNSNNIGSPLSVVTGALVRLLALYICLGALLRLALAFHPLTDTSSLTVLQWVGTFILGALNDTCVATLMLIPLAGFFLSSGHWKLRRPQCFVALAIIAGLGIYLAFGCKQLRDFNGSLARVIGLLMLLWFITFAIRAFIPKIRQGWMKVFTTVFLFVYIFLIYFNICGEWLFWNEFGVRYNFIAVDYLVYTSEVVGNIMQSYSMGWAISGVVALTALTEWVLFRRTIARSADIHASGWRLHFAVAYFVVCVASVFILPQTVKMQQTKNAYFNELQAAGPYSFVQAFFNNKLDYNDFYPTLPEAAVTALMAVTAADSASNVYEPNSASVVDSIDSIDSIDSVDFPALTAPRFPHIILITMESMSADYMHRFGNEDNLTPALDSLAAVSLTFDRMFAAGNRTVRGLEALVMSRPPTPGESIIKRPGEMPKLPSIVDALKANGYESFFYYGGDSYFDNMESFFGNLGYEIRDRKSMPDSEVTCQTVWGVCDEDVYNRILADLDEADRDGQRVFAHVLTTSNHRPYIYPEGRVAIPPTKKSRKGAVMYSDYALGRFISDAAKHDWGQNALFVIVADHCASSAGSTEIPLANYHIPAMVYAPGLIEPAVIDKTVSQIDLMPTVFGLLGWDTDKNLYGRNALAPDFDERAFVATYQDLGYLSGDTLTVLSPGRKCRSFVCEPTSDNPYETREIEADIASRAARKAIANYQSAAVE